MDGRVGDFGPPSCYLDVPALSAKGIPDALNRESGQWLELSRGRTVDDWEETREIVGPRVFSALY